MDALGRGRPECVGGLSNRSYVWRSLRPGGPVFRGPSSTWWASGVWATPARLRATGCPYGARRVECGQPRNRRSRLSTPLWCGQLGCPHGRVLRCSAPAGFWLFAVPVFSFSPPQGPPEAPRLSHVLMVQPQCGVAWPRLRGLACRRWPRSSASLCIATRFRIVSM